MQEYEYEFGKKRSNKNEAEGRAPPKKTRFSDPSPEKIRKRWCRIGYSPPLSEIVTAARLAHQGLLGSVAYVNLWNLDLASVPTEHLASLFTCITESVDITEVSNCDLRILDSVLCKWLDIGGQTLGNEETQAMVWSMESNVECVSLRSDVSLDIAALTQYGGLGKCEEFKCHGDTADRYREEMRSWARRINWNVSEDDSDEDDGDEDDDDNHDGRTIIIRREI